VKGSLTRLKTILVADDEPSMRTLVAATIDPEAFRVVEAVDGNDAWRAGSSPSGRTSGCST
jgi:CheY-like chemotaxis protein